MSEDKNTTRITLRLEQDFKHYLDGVAGDLGIGLNVLMNLLIRRSLGSFQVSGCDLNTSTGGKRTQVSLRIRPDLDDRIRRLGGELNTLIADLLHHSLPHYVVEARICKEYVVTGRYERLYGKWRRLRPAASVQEFDGELRKLLSGEPTDLSKIERPAPPAPIPNPTRYSETLPDIDGPLTDEDAF